MNSVEYEEIAANFERVLHGLLQQNYSVTSDVYFDMFIKHLSNKTASGIDYSLLLQRPTVLAWMEQSVEQIVSERRNVAAFTFTCRLLALLSENADHFVQLNERNIYSRLKHSIDIAPALQTPSAKLAIVSLYRSMMKHPEGMAWLKREFAWKKIIEYCIENQTIYLVRSCADFITDYVFLIADSDEELSLGIASEITRPLEENSYIETVGYISVDSSDLQCKVLPSIQILRNIFDRYVDVGRTLSIRHHLAKTCKGSRNLWKLLDMTQDADFFETIMMCKVFVNYGGLVDTLNAQSAATSHDDAEGAAAAETVNHFNEFGLTFLNNINVCLLKNQQLALLAVARQYYILWRRMGARVPESIMLGNQLTKFENQMIVIQLMPLIQLMRRYPSRMIELYEEYILKLFNNSAEHTLRICYSFRESLIERNLDLTDISCKAIQSIISMKHYLHRDPAVLVFQALCHTVKGAAFDMEPEDFAAMVERPALLTAVVNGLYTIVKKYRITWKESYETIALLNCSLGLLEQAGLPPRLAVDVLKLSQLSLEHFLATNMALLVDTMSGSDMQKLGPIVLKRLHDPNWEVRDSAIELLTSTAKISMLKFPAFQQHIISNGLCPIVVQIAQHDSEFYVRASALACLRQMVELNAYWEKCTSSVNLTTYLIDILKTEYEGIVRKEAVQLLAAIYENKKFEATELSSIYCTMTHAAINDLFWEVKVKALDFWHSVIRDQLTYQGVIDGSFPSVTFSKEKKKIVTLTEKEITLRLTRMLDDLSASGCLTVLMACMRDEDDLMVVMACVSVIKFLRDFLDKYTYWQQMQQSTQYQQLTSAADAAALARRHNTARLVVDTQMEDEGESIDIENEMARADEIIQNIVSAQDINLLTIAYENQMSVDNDDDDSEDQDDEATPSIYVTAHQFLREIMSIHLDGLVKSRTDWIAHTDSFASLLNDMMYSLQVIPANEADCY